MSATAVSELHKEVRALALERDAVILAHNYQRPDVQDVADYVGDSLGLSQQAAATEASTIVFCGVHFMAETAAILAPDRTRADPRPRCWLLTRRVDHRRPTPRLEARASRCRGRLLRQHDGRKVKAESDYCCTSGNAQGRDRGRSRPTRRSLFLPDLFLGIWLEKVTGRKLQIWMGECHVHAGIRPQDIERWQADAPDAELLAVHPGVRLREARRWRSGMSAPTSSRPRRWCGSHRSRRASGSSIATETGIIHRLGARGTRQDLLSRSARTPCAST